ncbi:MAG: hypothetical protein EPO21_05185 [Chloroflexota bacterium]|nr:MAG: hypothetical protein EPO21_05185 [Chloroflexota bacterium]
MFYKTGTLIVSLCTLLALLSLGRIQTVGAQTPDATEEERHATYIIRHLGPDGDVERYEFTLRPGATLFDIATESLPMMDPKEALDLVQQGYKTTYPNRNPNQITIGDTFSVPVSPDTFVARTAEYKPDTAEFVSFSGDRLSWYGQYTPIRYRLVKVDNPDEVLVALNPAPNVAPAELARLVWGWDQPDFQADFLQMGVVASYAADQGRVVKVDVNKRYMDPLRNFQNRAIKIEDGPDGAKVYSFDPADPGIPFFRVEDRINGQADIDKFPTGVLRTSFMKTGQVQQIRLTGFGEFLRVINRPQHSGWSALYAQWAQNMNPVPTRWDDGQPGDLGQFPSAKRRNSYFTLEGGRLLELTYDPQPPIDDLVCLGRPLVVIGGLMLGAIVWRRRNGRWLP